LFDYGDNEIGKPRGIDIKERKMTLPLIYALNHATPKDKKHIINLVKNENENPDKVKEVIAFVKISGGLEYTQKRMFEFRDKAIEILHTFPASDYRNSLEILVNYTIDRKY
jgi:octaprenyl-diphosphate synthase